MANLGKLITAAGGAIVAVFGIVAWIVALATKGYELGAAKTAASFEAWVLILLGAAIAVGALLPGLKTPAKCLMATGGVVVFLASSLGRSDHLAMLGGLNFYIILGGLVAIAGAVWAEQEAAEVSVEPDESAADEPPAPGAPPESRL